MKIRWKTMAGTNHSWSFVIQSLARAMVKIGGNEVFITSTNGLEHFPDDLKPLLTPGYQGHFAKENCTDYLTEDRQLVKVYKDKPLPDIQDKNYPYDMDLAYTVFYQAPRRFHHTSKMKALIWNFESSILPPGWNLYNRAIDYILPSSQFSYDIFASNGIPKDKMLIVPHGVDTNLFNPNIPPFKLKTQKKVKLLHNAIPHARKCHDRVLKAYLDTFTGDDDVCLVMKTRFKEPDADKPFEVNVKKVLEEALKGRSNPAEIEIVDTFIDDIGSLYTACDVVISLSSTEGWDLPLHESLACDRLVIAPRHGGQMHFLNDDNSLLVDTGEMFAPQSMQYWNFDPKAVVGDPSVKHFSELLRYAYENLDKEKDRVREAARKTVEKFSWEAAAQMILDLPIPKPIKAPMKRKVLYIVPYRMSGGGEVWVREAIKNLDRNIYEPHVALVSGTNEAIDNLFKDLNVTIEDLEHQGRDNGLKCLIESGKYSLIHFYNSFGVYNVLKACYDQGMRVRVVETVHSDLAFNGSMMKVAKREDFVSAIAAVSNGMARKLLKGGNKNVVSLPQMVDWSRFEGAARSKDILKEFGVPDGFVVGFVGRLSPEKNIPMVLSCAKNLPDVSFVIVGSGPQESPLKQMAKELKNVFFVGARTDVEKFYPAFDALMLPSTMEGLPLVIIESMLTGTPVIASDVGAINELVIDSLNGYVIWNPNETWMFVQAINNLRNNDIWNQFSTNSFALSIAAKAKAKQLSINVLYNKLF
jgi:glycosyltransferase involved in cell wall biosynthesis